MHRFVFAIVLLFFHTSLFAGDLVRYPEAKASFHERVQWAFESARGKTYFWTGYSVSRLMYPDEIFLSGVSFNGGIRFDKSRPSLQEWISGVKIVPQHDVRKAAQTELNRLDNRKAGKVWKEIGIFQGFQRGQMIPDKICVIDFSVSHNFDQTLFWLGSVSHEESFQYLADLYTKIQKAEEKEDLIAAIGIHPPALSFPFFKKILTGKEPQEAQESAAIFAGELGTPEALNLLREVAEKNPWKDVRESAIVGISEMGTPESLKVLTQVAWFDSNSDIRETAVVMLGESENGVPALLKIMESHPSAETREAAVNILAETVAGREVLKKKVKQD